MVKENRLDCNMMAKKHRLLYIVGDLPWPLDSGPRIRQYHILKGLAAVAKVTLLALPRVVRPIPRELEDICDAVQVCMRPASTVGKSRLGKVRQLFGELRGLPADLSLPACPIDIQCLFGCDEEDFDCIWIERINVAMLARNLRGVSRFLDLDDIEHRKRGRSGNMSGGWLRRTRRAIEARAWRIAEFEAISEFQGVSVCSEEDRGFLGRSNVIVIPNGAAVDGGVEFTPGVDGRMIFVGSLSYEPNDDALCYFIGTVLPRIVMRCPSAHLQVVGRHASMRLRSLAANSRVELLGFVEDVGAHLKSAAISVAPIRVGGGTRLKILESLAAMKPVVSTSLGAEGLGLMDREEIRIADSAESFADACVDLLSDPVQRFRLAEAGHRVAADRFCWSLVRAKVAAILGHLVRG